jgi:phosphoglucosamine mutase
MRGRRSRVVIGKDTRLSGYMLESALEAGIVAAGADVMLVGPLPTPAIAFITSSMRADAGVVISASHNPYQDNGIKIFASDGFKLPDEVEADIERRMIDPEPLTPGPEPKIGKAIRIDDGEGRYVQFLKHSFPKARTLDGVRVVVDCAHGAAYRVAPQVFTELGADLTVLSAEPNGRNINDNCGALHPEKAAAEVRRTRSAIGIALDGDADRVILTDERGEIVDGDQNGRWRSGAEPCCARQSATATSSKLCVRRDSFSAASSPDTSSFSKKRPPGMACLRRCRSCRSWCKRSARCPNWPRS